MFRQKDVLYCHEDSSESEALSSGDIFSTGAVYVFIDIQHFAMPSLSCVPSAMRSMSEVGQK